MNNVWILTREVNQYDQEGAYFVAAFKSKPTIQQLTEFGVDAWESCSGLTLEEYIKHIHDGGGRVAVEQSWYNLEEFGLN